MPDIKTCFDDIDNSSAMLARYVAAKGNDANLEDKLLSALAVRTVKFSTAFLLVGRPGYYEPAATLCRAMYEGYLWARWIMNDSANGARYFATAKRKAQDKAKKLDKHGGLQPRPGNQEMLEAQLDKVPTVAKIIEDLIQQDGAIGKYHDYVYDYLCDFSHGNAAGTIDATNNRVSMLPEPEHEALLMIAMLSRGIVANFSHMLEMWWTEGKIAAPIS